MQNSIIFICFTIFYCYNDDFKSLRKFLFYLFSEFDFAFWQASHIAMGVIAAVLKRMPDIESVWPHVNNLPQHFHYITDIDIVSILLFNYYYYYRNYLYGNLWKCFRKINEQSNKKCEMLKFHWNQNRHSRNSQGS